MWTIMEFSHDAWVKFNTETGETFVCSNPAIYMPSDPGCQWRRIEHKHETIKVEEVPTVPYTPWVSWFTGEVIDKATEDRAVEILQKIRRGMIEDIQNKDWNYLINGA